jgi:DNA-directed RNA polymerase subunit RPC12/RpoP
MFDTCPKCNSKNVVWQPMPKNKIEAVLAQITPLAHLKSMLTGGIGTLPGGPYTLTCKDCGYKNLIMVR